jgi:5-methylcytosine-specific restriction endonuclease McrA
VTHHDEIRIYQRSKAPEYVALNKKWSIMHPVRRWAISSISSHKTRGYKLNISINEVEKLATNTEFCPICGIKLDYSRHRGLGPGPQPNSPSLDRIENTDTLNIDNVWVICIRCNNHKSDKSMKEFVEYCRHVVEIFGGD